ncbi:MAG: hypothetical protein H7Z74_16895 [Anaerolineae bacterium]|nr:hypothetical protein [Gemmatimonadaceae bacterium]
MNEALLTEIDPLNPFNPRHPVEPLNIVASASPSHGAVRTTIFAGTPWLSHAWIDGYYLRESAIADIL